jgi:predicted Zn-dependent peptidase
MQNLNLKDDEFQPERKVVAEERLWRTDNNPMGYLYFRLFNTAYLYHPYHWTPIGFMNDIQTWSLEDIQKFHATYYQPKNAIVMVTGDIEPKAVFDAAQKHFGAIGNTVEIPKVITVEPKQDGARRVEVLKESEVEMLAISFPIPNFQDPDQPKLSALSELLSSGKSSRLYKTLVDKKQLVNQIHAYNMETIDPGVFVFLAIANQGVKAETIEKAIWTEIEKLQQEGVSQSELDKVKISTKAEFVYSLESSTSVAELFGSYLARGDIAPLKAYEGAINALTSHDIQEVAKRYFNHDHSTTLILRKGKQ